MSTAMSRFSRLSALLTLALLAGLAPHLWLLPLAAQQSAPVDESASPSAPESTPSAAPTAAPLRILSAPAVEFLSSPLVQAFNQQVATAEAELTVESSETALQAVLSGEADFAAIARPLTPTEEAQGLVQVPLDREAIAVVVSQANPFKADLTLVQFADIVRGDITDWSVLGGPVSSIRLLDRAAESPVRQALSRYTVFGPQLLTGPNTEVIESEDLETLVQALGTDGITYAPVSELSDRPDLRVVAIDSSDPTQADYPFSLIRTLVYQEPLTPAKQALLSFLETPLAQDTLESADPTVVTSRPIEPSDAAADPTVIAPITGEAEPEAAVPLEIPPAWQAWLDELPPWARWAVMPIVLLLVLLGAALQGRKSADKTDPPKMLPPSAEPPPAEEEDVRIEIPDEILATVNGESVAPAIAGDEDKLTQARLALAEGIRQAELGHYEMALSCLHQAIEAADLERLKAAVSGASASSLVALLAGGLIRRGMVLAKLGRADEALESFETALNLEPGALSALKGKHSLLRQTHEAETHLPENIETQAMTDADTVALTGTLPELPDLTPAEIDEAASENLSPVPLPINWPDPPQPADIQPALETDEIARLEPVIVGEGLQSAGDIPEELLSAIAEIPDEAEDLSWRSDSAYLEDTSSDVPPELQAAVAALPDEAAILPWAQSSASKLSLANSQIEPSLPSPAVSSPAKPVTPQAAVSLPGVQADQGPPEDILQAVQMMPNSVGLPGAVAAATMSNMAESPVSESIQPDEVTLSFSPCDAQWGYVHWDLPAESMQQIAASESLLALRLYDVTDWQPQQPLPRDFQQQECYRMARDWYLPIPLGDRDYLVELGYFSLDKRWQTLARSAPVHF